MVILPQINPHKLRKLISRGMFKYFYDMSKLTYAGIVLVGVQQKQVQGVITGLCAAILLFFIARIMEEECLSHPSLNSIH